MSLTRAYACASSVLVLYKCLPVKIYAQFRERVRVLGHCKGTIGGTGFLEQCQVTCVISRPML